MSLLIFNFEIVHLDFNFYEIAVFLSHWWNGNYREPRANVSDYPLPIKGIISRFYFIDPFGVYCSTDRLYVSYEWSVTCFWDQRA